MTIRAATPDDSALALQWAAGHGREASEALAFPEIGCVCEDDSGPCAMVWACRCDELGIAFLENLVMRPGLGPHAKQQAGSVLMRGIAVALKTLGFSRILSYSLPACARYLAAMGWEVADERVKIAMTIKI